MPNEKILNEKRAVVEALTDKLRSTAGVLVDYSGITVAEDTELRVKLRAEDVEYSVVKNTLMRFAAKNVGLDGLDPLFNGTTSLAISRTDPVAPARIIKEYAAKFVDHFAVKGGFMDGKVLSIDEVNALASIPPTPILKAQLLGTMLAPIISLAAVVQAIADKAGAPAEGEATAEAAAQPVEATAAEETPAQPVEATAAEETPAQPVEAAVTEETPAQPVEAAAPEETAPETAE